MHSSSRNESESEQLLDSHDQPIDHSYFLTEGCAAFALILARRLHDAGEPAAIAVISRTDGEPWSEDHDFELTHVVVAVPGGYVDVLGFHEDFYTMAKRIGAAYCREDVRLIGNWDVDDFEQRYVGLDDEKPLYGVDEEIQDWVDRLLDATPGRYGLATPGPVPKPLRL